VKRLIFVISLLINQNCFSYPQFIGFGYNTCISCHYNPYGSGPLRDYGRAQSSTVISDRILYPKEKTEENIALNSGFTYRPPFNDWLRPSLFYRGLALERDLFEQVKKFRWINMQAEGNLVFKFGKQDNFYGSFTFGYVPAPPNIPTGDESKYWRWSEHYIGYRPVYEFGIYLGLMAKVFGIRIPDHVAYSRIATGNTQYDQTHSLTFHYVKHRFEGGLQFFNGNLFQDEPLRPKGVTTKLEYEINNKFKPGISVMAEKSDFLKSYIFALHSKNGYSKGSATLLEAGIRRNEAVKTTKTEKLAYGLLQNFIYYKRGMFGIFGLEYLKPNLEKNLNLWKFDLGFQYFIIQGVEFRFDLYNNKTFQKGVPVNDSWTLLGQIHLWP
jgi:hypothetical protein